MPQPDWADSSEAQFLIAKDNAPVLIAQKRWLCYVGRRNWPARATRLPCWAGEAIEKNKQKQGWKVSGRSSPPRRVTCTRRGVPS